MSIDSLVDRLEQGRLKNKLSNIVLVAEGGKSGNAADIAKAVSARFPLYEVKVTILGHIQRGGSPTAADRTLASTLGVAAVESLRKGSRDVMVGMINGKLTETPFDTAINQKLSLDANMLRITDILST